MPGSQRPVENLKLLTELQEAINSLPTLTAEVVVEDEWGQKYDLIRSFAIGQRTDDSGLVLKIRMRGVHPDAGF